jgi:peroxiredoxin
MTSDPTPPNGDSTDLAIPDHIRVLIDEMVEDLRNGGAVPGIATGERAPDFTLPDAHGNEVALGQRLREGPVVLSFYRGDWCPICNTELHGLQEILPDLRTLGASLIAVSPQAPDTSLAFVDKLGLDYDVLSDLDQTVAECYRIKFRLSDGLEQLYRKVGLALPERNADESWNLPVPATFVIDTDGIIRARHVDPDYRQRMEPSDILDALRQIVAQQEG